MPNEGTNEVPNEGLAWRERRVLVLELPGPPPDLPNSGDSGKPLLVPTAQERSVGQKPSSC